MPACSHQLSWVLYADVVCLNANGNVTDAVVLALLGALMNSAVHVAFLTAARLPKVVPCDEGLPKVDLDTLLPLRIQRTPLATSFALFKGFVAVVFLSRVARCWLTPPPRRRRWWMEQ